LVGVIPEKAWLTKPGSKENQIVKRRLQLASLPYLGEIDSVHLKLEGVAYGGQKVE